MALRKDSEAAAADETIVPLILAFSINIDLYNAGQKPIDDISEATGR
jgi:hypothetical protein